MNYNYEVDTAVLNEAVLNEWIAYVISSEEKKEGELNYIFCSDDYLLEINRKFLNHDTYTDIISFDYTVGRIISGDIYISVERVSENAETYKVDFLHELYRVMVHGILHYCGYKDHSPEEKVLMREREDFYLTKLKALGPT